MPCEGTFGIKGIRLHGEEGLSYSVTCNAADCAADPDNTWCPVLLDSGPPTATRRRQLHGRQLSSKEEDYDSEQGDGDGELTWADLPIDGNFNIDGICDYTHNVKCDYVNKARERLESGTHRLMTVERYLKKCQRCHCEGKQSKFLKAGCDQDLFFTVPRVDRGDLCDTTDDGVTKASDRACKATDSEGYKLYCVRKYRVYNPNDPKNNVKHCSRCFTHNENFCQGKHGDGCSSGGVARCNYGAPGWECATQRNGQGNIVKCCKDPAQEYAPDCR